VARVWLAQGGRSLNETDAFVAADEPDPTPGPRDLVVRVEAVSINPADTQVRASLEPGQRRQLGWDAAGTVVGTGAEVTRFAVGDEVFYAGDVTRPGANAELHAVDERLVGHRPASLSWAESAALPLTAITAWETLFERLGLSRASRGVLLVVGGAGGVGSILIQLAKVLTGVTVVATASRGESQQWVRELGADYAVDHHDLIAGVTEVAPGGIDWVFSAHTGANIEAYASLLRPFGQIVAIDQPPNLDLLPLKDKSICFHWELMFTRSTFRTADMTEQGRLLDRVASLADDRWIRSTLRVAVPGLDPEGLRRAHSLVEGGTAIGKVVVHH
jgi:NADPH:quinone reductase